MLRPGEVALGRHCGSSVARRSRRPSPVTNPGRHAANPHLHPPPARAAPSPTCERCWLPPTVEQPKEKKKKKQKKTKKTKKTKKSTHGVTRTKLGHSNKALISLLSAALPAVASPGPASTICEWLPASSLNPAQAPAHANNEMAPWPCRGQCAAQPDPLAPSLPSASAVSGSVRTQVKRPLGTYVCKPPG